MLKINKNGLKRMMAAGAAAVLAISLASFGFIETAGNNDASSLETADPTFDKSQIAEKKSIDDVHLRDKDLLYSQYDPKSVVTFYLTVSTGNASDGTDHTWEEINTYSAYDYDAWGVPRFQVNGILQIGDENGPIAGEVGYGEIVPNATVQIRGQTSSTYSQKNYKIRLIDDKGLWRGEQTIPINKHEQDGLRFRNKMAYDLISEIPQIMSLRTQFVHLYVKDLTDGIDPSEAKFEDYGLYTHVEQLNKKCLRNHGLDRNGHLYKINFMEFFRYEDTIKLVTDPDYDEAAFNALLEAKGSSDHTKLIQMLDAVNDYTLTNEELLENYFDEENIAYWMAFMILVGNSDTQNRNMYIYSPLNGNKWYILPWDNDAMLRQTEDEFKGTLDVGSWESGVSNYWGTVVFKRFLQLPSFRKALDDAVKDLHENYLTKEHISELAHMYAEVVRPYVYSMPDMQNARLTEDVFDVVVDSIADECDQNYYDYLESLEKPMPFYIGEPVIENGQINFIWDAAYDLDKENITYNVKLARDYDFQDVLFEEDGIRLTTASCPAPEPGQYFLHVDATNESGYTQDCFDYYATGTRGKAFGTYCFYVLPGGQIEIEQYVEADDVQ